MTKRASNDDEENTSPIAKKSRPAPLSQISWTEIWQMYDAAATQVRAVCVSGTSLPSY
jgi:hypothetical protein